MKTVLITGVSRGIGKALGEKVLVEDYIMTGTPRSDYVIYHMKKFSEVHIN